MKKTTRRRRCRRSHRPLPLRLRRRTRPDLHRGQGRDQLLALGRQPASRLPAVRRRLHQGQPGHQGQDHPARLGRLLDHPDQRLRRRHRPGRLHRPPGQVPRVRLQEAAPRPGRRRQERQARPGHLQQGPGRPLGRPGRQTLRPAQGLGHRRHVLQQEAASPTPAITEEQLKDLDWNPQDGGSYEKAIAHLTVDKNGVRGDEPGFDKNNVAVYGLGLENSGGGTGQTQWSFLTATMGWTHTDKNPWGTQFNYDDPKFQETIAWWAGLVDKGYMPKLETTVGASVADNFGAGKAAINTNGSWMIGQYTSYKGVETGIAPTPKGPDGKRASPCSTAWPTPSGPAPRTRQPPSNGSSTSPPPPARTSWPPRPSSSPPSPPPPSKAAKAFEAKGIDVSAFTTHVKDEHHVPLPDRRQSGQGRGHHEAGHGRRALRQEAGQLLDRGQRAGQRPLQVGLVPQKA